MARKERSTVQLRLGAGMAKLAAPIAAICGGGAKW